MFLSPTLSYETTPKWHGFLMIRLDARGQRRCLSPNAFALVKLFDALDNVQISW